MKIFKHILLIGSLFLSGCTGFPFFSDASGEPFSSGKTNSTSGKSISNKKASIPAMPTHITLLLPLDGKLGQAGKAVQNGFMTAYYEDAAVAPKTIDIVDTSKYPDIESAYQQAVDKGSQLVIGPLEKKDVRRLAHSNNLPVAILALNYSDEGNPPVRPGLYKFSLSPRDEARQVAKKAWQDGHRNVLMIAPAGSWGEGIDKAFRGNWIQSGGKVIDSMVYSQPSAFAEQIRTLLQVKQAPSSSASTPHQASNSLPEHRNDADSVFLVAQPAVARQIMPLLKFYYGGDVAVYAPSLVYSGKPNVGSDSDLDGIVFCDMPWALSRGNPLHQQVSNTWPRSYEDSVRLYGLGIDAYKLSNELYRLSQNNNAHVEGVTGVLSVGSHQHITRDLVCAKFQNGIPVPENKEGLLTAINKPETKHAS